jgi:hypothetical protein
MACCIFLAMVITQILLSWDKLRRPVVCRLATGALAAVLVVLLAWHWPHLKAQAAGLLPLVAAHDATGVDESHCGGSGAKHRTDAGSSL